MRPPVGIGWRHPHYAALLASRPALDFIEVHSENFFAAGGAALNTLLSARAHYPVSLHGVGLALGSVAGVDPWHLDQLAWLVERVEPVRVSDHACFARVALAGPQRVANDVHGADLLPVPFNQTALTVMCANVSQVQDRLKRPLLIENLSAYLTLAGADCTEPEFLCALAERTGCGLLVDVNNLMVNALNEGLARGGADPVLAQQACLDWLDQIPAHLVGELHVAGHQRGADIVVDDHGSRVSPAVWAVYRHAQRRFQRVPALVEWDTDIPPLQVLLDEAEHARRVNELSAEYSERTHAG